MRSNEKNLELYNMPANIMKGSRSINELDLSKEGERLVRRIEEQKILNRWKSPSIMEALKYRNVIRSIILNTAIFFKYRVVNKRLQLYSDQIDNFTTTLLHVSDLSI